MSEEEIKQSAWLLYNVHGKNAWVVASKRANDCHEMGDSGGERDWTRVLSILAEVSAKNRDPFASIH